MAVFDISWVTHSWSLPRRAPIVGFARPVNRSERSVVHGCCENFIRNLGSSSNGGCLAVELVWEMASPTIVPDNPHETARQQDSSRRWRRGARVEHPLECKCRHNSRSVQ